MFGNSVQVPQNKSWLPNLVILTSNTLVVTSTTMVKLLRHSLPPSCLARLDSMVQVWKTSPPTFVVFVKTLGVRSIANFGNAQLILCRFRFLKMCFNDVLLGMIKRNPNNITPRWSTMLLVPLSKFGMPGTPGNAKLSHTELLAF